jgi:hypothetical protein
VKGTSYGQFSVERFTVRLRQLGDTRPTAKVGRSSARFDGRLSARQLGFNLSGSVLVLVSPLPFSHSPSSARGARVDARRFRVRQFGLYVFSLKRFTLTVILLVAQFTLSS